LPFAATDVTDIAALPTVAAWSYGFTAAVYVAFALRMLARWRPNPRAALLLAATLLTAAWAAAGVGSALSSAPAARIGADAADALRYGAWFLFIRKLLEGGGGRDAPTAIESRRSTLVLIGVALAASFALSDALPLAKALGLSHRHAFGLDLALAVFGLTLVEQLLRRADPQSRWGVRPLAIALAGTFGFDLFLFADAMLFGRLDGDIWIARAIANAIVVPFIAVSTARNTGWAIEMHMSRRVVFQTTALLLSGAFLLAVAGAGYVIRFLGGDWARALSIELVFAALLLGAMVIGSGRFRSRLKVFVSKHFFSYRYDYREEWLRFTRTLATEPGLQRVQERVVMALCNLVESPSGALWLADAARGFVPSGRWNMAAVDAVEPIDGSLPSFIERTGWVVNVHEHASEPARYPGLTLPPWLAALPGAWLVVPLASANELIGFVVLTTPRTAIDVDWEVLDLLKTASRQAANYLGEIRATEALLEARKFDAFNRMSAFVVHDLKNLIAQLSLMLKNAERHRDNPDFQRDMLETVQNVVGRMNALMLQLRAGTTPVEKPRPVDLEPLVRRVCAAKAGAQKAIELDLAPGVCTFGHDERLEHVIAHLLQNALDATADGGRIGVRLDRDGEFARIEVSDTGVGMNSDFIRERLFRPFETTKPAGMGIGVYESAQYVATLGGRVLIDSAPNAGTRVRVLLPAAEAAAASPALKSEAA
jgi:putative PEP-CTERM system histidine kinase